MTMSHCGILLHHFEPHRNCEADQRLYFRYTDSKIPLLLKVNIECSTAAILCSCTDRFRVRPFRKPRRPVVSRCGSFFLACESFVAMHFYDLFKMYNRKYIDIIVARARFTDESVLRGDPCDPG